MLKAFAVYDAKACSFGMPMFIANAGLALRGFSDACADPQSSIAKHPEDYVLFEIGVYDANSGVLDSISPHKHVASASSVMALVTEPAPAPASQPSLPIGNGRPR